ncbi:hypothetical protein PTTG_08183 [Puccinia triticina 1-1 BBBD Race 1]|uniref:CCHC-type domain-containing protein n=1 Tax=Puccinia triticina (isolate 1-1 / race 1 (BBBD)) TaxID=630390 RepID=A0A180G7K7_PUCT1|nr:hypothetical protein PTTG_08183 [Puccinia triticina 1-1 BBBD Race 1]
MDTTLMSLLLQLLDSEAEKKRMILRTMEEMRQTMQEMKRAMADLRELPGRVTTIEAGQLPRKQPAPVKSYASTAAKPKAPPPPPTKAEMVAARPGLTIIHARSGTALLKEVGAEITVRKVNEVLEKMNATVQGEKILVKAVRFLLSGDVSFYSKNRKQKEWLNQNKHEWSKQVHPNLKASPSTYSILAHGIPRTLNVDVSTVKISIASDNGFLVDKIFRMRWLGGSRDSADPWRAGTVVISLTEPLVADLLVKQRGLFLNGCFHRVERFKKLLPQCFKCLQMGHFGKWCRADPKCRKCGEKHETRDCQDAAIPAGKICVICRDAGKGKGAWETHTPFDKAYSFPLVSSNETFVPSIIVQLNCHNSRVTTYSILNTKPDLVIFLILQEPWINPLTCLPPDHEAWWKFYSPEHQPKDLRDKHRAVSYVQKSIASQNVTVLGGNSPKCL